MAAPAFKRLRQAVNPSVDESPMATGTASSAFAEPTAREIMLIDSGCVPEFTDCLAVRHCDDIDERVKSWPLYGDSAAMTCLDEAIGRFWKIAESFNGHPIFKREQVIGESGLELGDMYIFVSIAKAMPGWVIARS